MEISARTLWIRSTRANRAADAIDGSSATSIFGELRGKK